MSIPADIKRDFPVLQQQVHDKPLIYLDSGNTPAPCRHRRR